MTTSGDSSDVFPAPVYKRTVLEPLFEGSKRHFADALSRINRAHAVMLAETGILDAGDAGRILAALRDIERVDRDSLTYTGEVEDYFFFVEGELGKKVGVDLAGRLHTGRSRNDIDHTVFKMGLKERIDGLVAGLIELVGCLIDVADRERSTLIVAYTHGQPAQPDTFGHYLAAIIEVLLRDLDRIGHARRTVDRCSMGAAAITTTGFPIDRHRMAALLGFSEPQENAYGCIAACDYITETYSTLKLCFLNLGRFIQDLAQWTAFEVGQLYVPDGFVQISSIMPQKRNPVPIEHLRLQASLTVGHCDAIVNAMRNTPFTDMNDSEGEVQAAGYAAFDTAGRVLDLLTALIGAVRINPDRVRANIDASCITITELADTLVREEGLSFRQAHDIAGVVAKAVVAAGGGLSDNGFEPFLQAFQDATGRAPGMDEASYRTAVSPEAFVAVRERFGGPGPAAMADSLSRYRAQLEAAKTDRDRAQTEADTAEQALAAAVQDLVSAVGGSTGEE